ncbi:PAS-domain containing protein [Fodinicurvata fenggangensis]|uniref:PAS-domain containing protein n=1 Tax=Fodinicurvata fenggangensis TaxID=1121830 RepID=UPI00068A3AD1|nr:PAS-domain containing protein [Fodinicurvata fenggangensis]
MSVGVILSAALAAGLPVCAGLWLGWTLHRARRRQRELEARLAELERKQAALQEITEEWQWETDAEHRFTWFSDNYVNLTCHPGANYIGKTRGEIMNLEVEPGLWEQHLRDLEAHRPFRNLIYMCRGHDGGLRVFRTSGQPRFDAGGTFLGYRGVASDITGVASAGKQADVAQQRLQEAVDSMPQGLALFDANEELIVANKVYRDSFSTLDHGAGIKSGITFEEVARAAHSQRLTREWDVNDEAAIQRRLAIYRNPPYRIELSYSVDRTLEVTGNRTAEGGQVILWSDITEMKRRESALTLLVTGPARGRDFLETACEALSVLLNYRFAGIAQLEANEDRAHVLSCWLDGQAGETFSYDLEGTPCDGVYRDSSHCYIAENADARFPEDEMLVQLGGQAFVGEALFSQNAEKIGHIFAVHDQPDSEKERHRDIVNLIARWVATELERREAEEERLQQARLLQIFFDHMTEGIKVVDKDLRVLAYNKRFLEVANISPELMARGDYREIIRQSARRGDYGEGDVEELVQQRIERLFLPRPCVTEEVRPNGRSLEIRSNPLPDGGVVATYIDVTDRKQAEERLRESEHRYRLISDLASDMVFSYGLDENGRLGLEWHAGTLLSRLELPGLPETTDDWENLVVNEDRPVLRQCLLRLARGEDCSEEVRLQSNGDKPLWVRILARGEHDFESGRLKRVLGAVQDVSERRNAEAEMLQAMQATELANRTKSEFLATMSHELRTPLNAIIGFAEIMEHQMLGPLGDERYRAYSHDIRESGTHLLQIINDILEVSKAEAGRLELFEEAFRLQQLVESSIRLVQHRAENNGIDLDYTMAVPQLMLYADQRRLKQVLLNVLSNAIKFTPEGGRVHLEVVHVQESGVDITIRDSGIGIGAEDIQRVFEPFTQLDSGLGRRHEGTGLGLPLSRTLVELHGGELILESTPNEGTLVTIHLPPECLVEGQGAALQQHASGSA